jgi:transcriptional regulator with PAS, ATPase and Fis domain
MKIGEEAIAFARESGAAATLRACLANYGTALYLAGDWATSVEYFEQALTTLASECDNTAGTIDAMASVRIAEGRFEDASILLDRIDRYARSAADRRLYAFTYAQLTRLRLFIQEGATHAAARQADTLGEIATNSGDEYLNRLALLYTAEVQLNSGYTTDAVRTLIRVAPYLLSAPHSFYGHYERLSGAALARSGSAAIGHRHLQRARSCFDTLGSAPDSIELHRTIERLNAVEPPLKLSSGAHGDSVTDVAALLAYAGRPSELAGELVRLIRASNAATYVATVLVRDTSEVSTLDQHGTRTDALMTVIPLGRRSDGVLEMHIIPSDDVHGVLIVGALSMIVAAIREIECAKREREERLTVWPSDEVAVDTDGAVVIGKLRDVMTTAQKVARTTVSVLITGESGTGKEILARAVHAYSTRAQRPFVPFNCTAVPREMLESQLFGYRRGAFTGADRDHPGLIRAAKDGTLFLDEIGELGLDLQPKLLRFLESGEINPLGDASPFRVDVRVIAATNSNLEQLVEQGRFREDLFYRLNVIRLTVPPLRERRDEIPALVNHFVARAAAEFGKGRVRVAEETMEHLLVYAWPGNVRQLNNELRRMVALAEPDAVLRPSALSKDIVRTAARRAAAANGQELAVALTDKLTPTLTRIEREMIKVALRAHDGRVEAAARSLGISRKGLYLKRQRLGL